MYWLIFIFSLFPLLGFLVLGVFLMISAVTGRGMDAPEPGAPFVQRLQYRMRGPAGVVFFLVSAYSLLKLTFLAISDVSP
jgi:hypothetical protein